MSCIEAKDEIARGGRPAGDVRKALLDAIEKLASKERGPTLKELVQVACVSDRAARQTISNLRRSGAVCVARTRRVAYRNRPVAEYAPAFLVSSPQGSGFDVLASCWH
jgi:superfamily II helicase